MPNDCILIAFDGSENSAHAIRVAGELFPGSRAHVVHAWEPITSAAARSAVYALSFDDSPDILVREQEQANVVARRGIELARAAGFDATGAPRSGSGPLWATIVGAITELRPRLVVVGTRGLTGLRGAVAGSVSHHVTMHSDRPVLVVPNTDD